MVDHCAFSNPLHRPYLEVFLNYTQPVVVQYGRWLLTLIAGRLAKPFAVAVQLILTGSKHVPSFVGDSREKLLRKAPFQFPMSQIISSLRGHQRIFGNFL
jgi:hypothetical protein